MKLSFVVLAVFAAYTVSAVPLNVPADVPYSRFIEYTDEDGNLKTIDLEVEPDMELLSRNADQENIYILFTRSNPHHGQILRLNDANSVRNSNFNAGRETVVTVHGWLENEESGMNELLSTVLLNRHDVNVIVLDWGWLARSINYIGAVNGVPEVGRSLARFLSFVSSTTGLNFNNVHLVGFSLGGHVVGNAGRALGGQIARITALDPAGPLWNFNSDRINQNDARYVEGIHTDGGLVASLGIGTQIGNADFFPNGGNSQPGCLTGICDHNRAWRLFASSVTHDHFQANECNSSLQVTLNNCRGPVLNMGNNNIRKTGSGIFRVNTGRSYPF